METITFEQALNLKRDDVLYNLYVYNKDGSAQRWRVNGKVKTWKTMPNRIKVPLKHGLYEHDYLTESNLNEFSLTEPPKKEVFIKNNVLIKDGFRTVQIYREDNFKLEKVKGKKVTLTNLPDRLFFIHHSLDVTEGFTITDAYSGIAVTTSDWENKTLNQLIEKANDLVKNHLPKDKSFDDFVKDHLKKYKIEPILSNLKKFQK